jgi:hypothetical protein
LSQPLHHCDNSTSLTGLAVRNSAASAATNSSPPHVLDDGYAARLQCSMMFYIKLHIGRQP